MTITDIVQNLFATDESLCECRNCGTTVSRGDDRCPTCDATDIVCYEIESLS